VTPVCLVSSDCESGTSGKVAVGIDYVKGDIQIGRNPLLAAPAFGCADPAGVAREVLSCAAGYCLQAEMMSIPGSMGRPILIPK